MNILKNFFISISTLSLLVIFNLNTALASATMEMQDTKSFEKRLEKQREEQRTKFYSSLSEFVGKIEEYEKFCQNKNEKQFLKKLKKIIQVHTKEDKISKAP